MQLTVLDWDKLSLDDHFDSAAIEISEVADKIPKKDPDTGLFLRIKMSLVHSKVINSLTTAKEMLGESKTFPNNHIPWVLVLLLWSWSWGPTLVGILIL